MYVLYLLAMDGLTDGQIDSQTRRQTYIQTNIQTDSTVSLALLNQPHLFPFPDRLQNDSEENIQTIPTIGFNVEVLQYKNIKFQARFRQALQFAYTLR